MASINDRTNNASLSMLTMQRISFKTSRDKYVSYICPEMFTYKLLTKVRVFDLYENYVYIHVFTKYFILDSNIKIPHFFYKIIIIKY